MGCADRAGCSYRGQLAISLGPLAGCGWVPLYADRAAGPADKELAAIKVAPIPERIGQSLALGLRQWLNPTGEPVPSRYLLRTLLQTSQLDLGMIQFGLGTRARFDVTREFHADRHRHRRVAVHSLEPFGRIVRHPRELLRQCRRRGGCPPARDRGYPPRYGDKADGFLQRRAAPAASVP